MKKIAITIILLASMLLTQVLIASADESAREPDRNIDVAQIDGDHRPPDKAQGPEIDQENIDADTEDDLEAYNTLIELASRDDDDDDDDDDDEIDDDMQVNPGDGSQQSDTTPTVTITPESASDPKENGNIYVTYGDYVSWNYEMNIKDIANFDKDTMYSLSNTLGLTTSSAINKISDTEYYIDIEFFGYINVAAKDEYEVVIKFDGKGTEQELTFTVYVSKADISTEVDDMTYGQAEEISFDLGDKSTQSVSCTYFSDANCTQSATIDSETSVGTYYAKITFSGDDYYNSVDTVTSFKILQADISTKITLQDEEYFEADQTSVEKDFTDYLEGLELGQDYTVTYKGTQNLFGEITMTIDGIGNYYGSCDYTFNAVCDEKNQAIFKLYGQIEYTLDSDLEGLIGWSINDDGLVYSNGITFYVDQTTEYTITAIYED